MLLENASFTSRFLSYSSLLVYFSMHTKNTAKNDMGKKPKQKKKNVGECVLDERSEEKGQTGSH